MNKNPKERTEYIGIRVTPEEKEALKNLAAAAGMSSALFACFKHMSSLSVVGEFEELPLPPKVNKNIQSLTICDMGRTFNLETLNTFEELMPIEFNFYSAKKTYVAGYDLQFLKMAKKIGLYLYNELSEIEIDGFSKLGELKELTLYTEFIGDLDFQFLVYNSGIERFRIHIPKNYDSRVADHIAAQLADTKKRSMVVRHQYPFGNI